MKKVTYLLLLFTVFSFAQTTEKVKTKITAKIENRNSDTLSIYGNQRFLHTIVVNEKGLFESEFELTPGLHQMYDGSEAAFVYLEAGDNLKIDVDAANFDETLKFQGNSSKANNYLADKTKKTKKFEELAFSKDEAEFKSLLDAKKVTDKKDIDASGTSEDFKKMMTEMLKSEYYYMEMSYNEERMMAKLKGQPSPTFAYENYKGGVTKLEDFKGKIVYIDVWATWCGPCIGEIPSLKALEQKFHDKDIVFVSISIDKAKDKDKWKAMIEKKELAGVQLFADNDWNSQFVKDYGIQGIPRFILVGKNGEVINASADRPSSSTIEDVLNELVN